MYPTSKNISMHTDVISDEYITDKVQNQGEGQYSFIVQKI